MAFVLKGLKITEETEDRILDRYSVRVKKSREWRRELFSSILSRGYDEYLGLEGNVEILDGKDRIASGCLNKGMNLWKEVCGRNKSAENSWWNSSSRVTGDRTMQSYLIRAVDSANDAYGRNKDVDSLKSINTKT